MQWADDYNKWPALERKIKNGKEIFAKIIAIALKKKNKNTDVFTKVRNVNVNAIIHKQFNVGNIFPPIQSHLLEYR